MYAIRRNEWRNYSDAFFLPVVDNLLRHRPNLDLVDNDSKTALLHAAELRFPDAAQILVDKLLQAGADTEAQDADCKTALMKAIERKIVPMVDRLLQVDVLLESQDEVRVILML